MPYMLNVAGKINVFALSDFTMGRCLNLSASIEFAISIRRTNDGGAWCDSDVSFFEANEIEI